MHPAPAARAAFRAANSVDLTRVGSGRLGEFAEQNALPAAVRFAADHALSELLQNIIDHSTAGEIEYEFTVDAHRLTLTILDDGAPFDPLSVPSPDLELSIDDRPIGGLGVHMMRKLMDGISYQRLNGRNQIVMTKRISSPSQLNS